MCATRGNLQPATGALRPRANETAAAAGAPTQTRPHHAQTLLPMSTEPALQHCPVPQLSGALATIAALQPNATARAGGHAALLQHYLDTYKSAHCVMRPALPAWPLSQRAWGRRPGLLLNAGDGSTGTRYIDCIVRTACALQRVENGYNSSCCTLHGSRTPSGMACARWPADAAGCTAEYDAYDFVSDVPIPQILSPLLATHPGASIAGILLTVRDPWEWWRSRLTHGHEEWAVASPCFGTRLHGLNGEERSYSSYRPHRLAEQPAATLPTAAVDGSSLGVPRDRLVADALALCLARRRGRDLRDVHAVALETIDDETEMRRLWGFLRGRGPFDHKLRLTQVERAASHCRDAGAAHRLVPAEGEGGGECPEVLQTAGGRQDANGATRSPT